MIMVAAPVAINIAPAQRSLLLESPNFIDNSMPNDRTRSAPSALSCPRTHLGFTRDRHFRRASRQRPTCGRTSSNYRRGKRGTAALCQRRCLPDRPLPRAMTAERHVHYPLIRLDAARLHDPLPFAHFLHHEVAELARAHPHHLRSLRGELLVDLGRVLDRQDLPVHLRDDGCWRA